MKKKLIQNACALACLFFAMTGCLKEDIVDQREQSAEVNFSFDLGDINTKSDVPIYNEGQCKSLEELKTLAQGGHLKANITLAKTKTPAEADKINFSLRINHLGENHFQTLTYALDVTTYYVHAVTITSDKPEDSAVNPLFSGVGHDSKFAAYIAEGNHMVEAKFEVKKFEKTPVDLWVLCATKLTPIDFGFIKWNINYVQAHCFPFLVNVCTPGDVSGAGTLLIEYKNKDTNEYAPLQPVIEFNSNGKYDEICFKDDYAYSNTDELYKFTLTINGKTQVKYITLETLLQYKQSGAWDNVHNLMHLNFCTCETWIFDCETENTPVPPSKCLDKIRIVEGNSGTNGSDSYVEVAKETGSKDNPANPLFSPTNFEGWGNINTFEQQLVPNGDFTLPNGKSFRSINSVHFESNNKIMEVTLHIKTTSDAVKGKVEDLCDILFFSSDNTFIGYYRISGEVDENKPITLKKECDDLVLSNGNNHNIKLPTGIDKCYKIGIRTYSDAKWALNIKQFWLQL